MLTSSYTNTTIGRANPENATICTFDELKQDRLILGSPAEVIEQVMAYHEEFGAEFMWFMVDWSGMDPRFTLESIQRLGEEVIPQIKRATPVCRVP